MLWRLVHPIFLFFQRPTGSIHNQFSTGHANSPCTIVIGKAHIEKVHMPARPYRMLNNFVFNKKMDFNEDLSGKNIALVLVNHSPSHPPHVRVWMGAAFVHLPWVTFYQFHPKNTLEDLFSVLRGVHTGNSHIMFEEEKAGLENKDRPPAVWGSGVLHEQVWRTPAHFYLAEQLSCRQLEAVYGEKAAGLL